jgi:hypothetical protein
MRVARRSCVWTLAMLGWSERDCSEYLGHVDQRMIREVYLRVAIDQRSPIKVPWTIENSRFPWLQARKPRRVIPFAKPQLSADVEGKGGSS